MIFALPPAEAGIHPTEGKAKDGSRSQPGAVVYLMCDDLKAEMKRLKAKKVSCSAAATERWGIRTTLRLPSGAELGLYQPTHPTVIGLKSKMRAKSTRLLCRLRKCNHRMTQPVLALGRHLNRPRI